MTPPEQPSPAVAVVVAARPTIEGGGIRVNRPFPTPEADWFDPFLLLDEMAPTTHPPHPHRCFETVTDIGSVWCLGLH